MRNVVISIILAVSMIVLVVVGAAQAEVLYSDNFTSTIDYSSPNSEALPGRFGGTLGTMYYLESESAEWRVYMCGWSDHEPVAGGICLTTMGDAHPYSATAGMSLDHNFSAYNSLEIMVDMDPIVEERSTYPTTYDPSTDWSAVKFGTSSNDTMLDQGFVFKLSHNGAWQVMHNDVVQGTGSVAKRSGYYRLWFKITQAGDNDPAEVKVYIDGVNVGTYTIASGFQDNIISFVSYGVPGWGVQGADYHGLDNLVVTTNTSAPPAMDPNLLFGDDYNTTASYEDVNAEWLRETGRYASIRYAEMEAGTWRASVGGPGAYSIPGALTMLTTGEQYPESGTAAVRVVYNFEHFNSFAIEADIDPVVEDKSVFPLLYEPANDWSAIKFGTNYEDTSLGQGVIFRLYHSGAWEVLYGGDVQTSGSVASKTGYYHVRIEVAQDGNSDPAAIAVLIDGVNVADYTVSSGLQNNKITLFSYGPMEWGNYTGIMETHAWDNLKILNIPPQAPPVDTNLLFSDNFDASRDFASVNDEFLYGRQTGSLVSSAPITYTELENANRPWRVYLCGPSDHEPVAGGIAFTTMGEPAPGGESVGMRLNYNFEDYNSFALSVDCDPIVENRSSYSNDQDWSAIRFGTGFEDWGLGQGIVFKLYHSGAWEASVLGDVQGSGSVARKLPEAGSLLPLYYNLRFEVRQAGNSDPADIKAFIDGTQVWNHTLASGLQNNKISLVSYGFPGWGLEGVEYHGWDNLQVSVIESPLPPPPVASITDIKKKANGTRVHCTGIVSADLGGVFYIQDAQRTRGIRVSRADHGLVVGNAVDVIGEILSTPGEERYIEAESATKTSTEIVDVHPLGMNNRAVGGGDLGDPGSGLGQRGVTLGNGINNVGLLVRTFGRVVNRDTAVPATWCSIDDGSGTAVKVVVPTGVSVPDMNKYIAVTGACSCEGALRVLLARDSSDVLTVSP